MFIFHEQVEKIRDIIDSGEIGDLRLVRANFCFPKRLANDFRYNSSLGGGAIYDCGGYPLRLVSEILGDDIKVDAAQLYYQGDIDLYGTAHLSTRKNTAQIFFGMDNEYKCDFEIWGSQGIIKTDRIFSAPSGFDCKIELIKGGNQEKVWIVSEDRKSVV